MRRRREALDSCSKSSALEPVGRIHESPHTPETRRTAVSPGGCTDSSGRLDRLHGGEAALVVGVGR